MRNEILRYAIAIAVSASPFPGYAQLNPTLDDQTRALKVIGDAAQRICNSVSTSGSSQNVELSGEAKAELAGVIKNVAELGVKGAGKYESAEYNNVLQKDLAAIIKQNTNCRQAVFQALVDRMIPAQNPPNPPPATRSKGGALNSVKLALHDGDAIVIDVQVPKPGGPGDQRFLKEVGATVSVTTKNYDPQSGRGEIDKLSFGYADGRVTASDTTLNIANASSMGCSGSFRLAETGLLRGRITCRWGHAYPTYDATINLGP